MFSIAVRRPELGILFVRSYGAMPAFSNRGYLFIDSPVESELKVKGQYGLAILHGTSATRVKTPRSLIELAITDWGEIKVEISSPYLTLVSTGSYTYNYLRRKLSNLVCLSMDDGHASLSSLRHVRFIRIAGITARRLDIKSTSCLETLIMKGTYKPVHSTSASLRLLVACILNGHTSGIIRRNKEPIMAVRALESIMRHKPSITRVPGSMETHAYLIEENTFAEIVPQPRKNRRVRLRQEKKVVGRKKYFEVWNILEPMSRIFSSSPWPNLGRNA